MDLPRRVPLRDLQPSQLHVSREKLDAVQAAWSEQDPARLEPVPVRRYRDRLVLTDGHTRALAAHRAGHDEIAVVADEDDLDDEAYETCVGWCRDAGITSVADLDDRVVDAEAYGRLWLDRCRALHRDLADRRRGAARRKRSNRR